MNDDPQLATVLQQLAELRPAANSGDPAALQTLRELLDSNPSIWQRLGDLSNFTERTLIDLVAKDDSVLSESLERKLRALKEELGEAIAAPLERLCIERVAITWLALQGADMMASDAVPGSGSATYLLRRQQQADRQHQSAIRALVTLRRMLPKRDRSTLPPDGEATVRLYPSGQAQAM